MTPDAAPGHLLRTQPHGRGPRRSGPGLDVELVDLLHLVGVADHYGLTAYEHTPALGESAVEMIHLETERAARRRGSTDRAVAGLEHHVLIEGSEVHREGDGSAPVVEDDTADTPGADQFRTSGPIENLEPRGSARNRPAALGLAEPLAHEVCTGCLERRRKSVQRRRVDCGAGALLEVLQIARCHVRAARYHLPVESEIIAARPHSAPEVPGVRRLLARAVAVAVET